MISFNASLIAKRQPCTCAICLECINESTTTTAWNVARIWQRIVDSMTTLRPTERATIGDNGGAIDLVCGHTFHANCIERQVLFGDRYCAVCSTFILDDVVCGPFVDRYEPRRRRRHHRQRNDERYERDVATVIDHLVDDDGVVYPTPRIRCDAACQVLERVFPESRCQNDDDDAVVVEKKDGDERRRRAAAADDERRLDAKRASFVVRYFNRLFWRRRRRRPTFDDDDDNAAAIVSDEYERNLFLVACIDRRMTKCFRAVANAFSNRVNWHASVNGESFVERATRIGDARLIETVVDQLCRRQTPTAPPPSETTAPIKRRRAPSPPPPPSHGPSFVQRLLVFARQSKL